MAVKASFIQYDEDRTVDLQLYVDEPRQRVTDALPSGYEPDAYISFYWDSAKIEECGQYELLGIEILDVARLSDQDLRAIKELDPPRVDIPDDNLFDLTVAEVLRKARAKRLARLSPARA